MHADVVRLSSVCVYPVMHWQWTQSSEGLSVLNHEERRQDVHAIVSSSNVNVFPVHDWQGSFAVVFLKQPAWLMLHLPSD